MVSNKKGSNGVQITVLRSTLPYREVELVRGAAAIEHGSDAMGGILQLSSNTVPAQGLGGKVQMLGKSVTKLQQAPSCCREPVRTIL